jgi:hypothetical protein
MIIGYIFCEAMALICYKWINRCYGSHESVLLIGRREAKVLCRGRKLISTFANILYVIRRYIRLSAYKNQCQWLAI